MKLSKVVLKGYKSTNETQEVNLGDLTIMIGANGSGKSNFISLFLLLNFLTSGGLQTHIASHGFADSFLYMGSAKTLRTEIELHFYDQENTDIYRFVLAYSVGGNMIFAEETIKWQKQQSKEPRIVLLGNGYRESSLKDRAMAGDRTCSVVYENLARVKTFHFHNTDLTAKIRDSGFIEDNQYLRDNAGNLAAFLYSMRENEYKYYQRIKNHIQEIFPQFEDFDLHPMSSNPKYINLNWRGKGSDMLFGAHQISDGSLRFMALITLLLQPPKTMPNTIILDEPELGLHPSAIIKLAALLKAASSKTQIIAATQSAMLLNEMSPDDVCVVNFDQQKQCSIYKRLEQEKLVDWLNNYTLGQLWEKNVLGGKP
ncbi:chromosome segregation protein SMC [Synergistales bacterium]|nr:chromosome segregation protein SMC [Synergistales bacterium]